MTDTDDVLSHDDRLDAIALVRARLAGDTAAMRALLATAGQGMYVALLDLTAALAAVQGEGDPDAYLRALAARVRADRDNDNREDQP